MERRGRRLIRVDAALFGQNRRRRVARRRRESVPKLCESPACGNPARRARLIFSQCSASAAR
jgi:hypothetical protein